MGLVRRLASLARDAVSRADELENFHAVLDDMGHGRATARVKQFIVDAYVRGAIRGKHTGASADLKVALACFRKGGIEICGIVA